MSRHTVPAAIATSCVLVLAACGGDDGQPADAPDALTTEAAGEDGADDIADEEPLPVRTVTFTEPVTTAFECECPSMAVGSNGVDRVAVVRSMLLPTADADTDPTTLQVLDAGGELAWEFDRLSQTVGGMPADVVRVHGDALVVQGSDQTLIGLDWDDGDELWELANVAVSPQSVADRDDVFIIAGQLHGQVDGDGYVSHPRVSIVEVASGEARWTGQDVDKYAVTPDGAAVVIARFESGDAAELTLVDTADGSTTTVEVPIWTEYGWSLSVDEDGAIGSHFGPSGEREIQHVQVDWSAGTAEEVQVDASTSEESRVPGHPEAVRVDRDKELGLVIGASLDTDGAPDTVFAVDAYGDVLWEQPAESMVSWRQHTSEVSGEDRTSVRSASLFSAGESDPVLIVDARPNWFEETDGGITMATAGPGYTGYDALTGDELWAWGDKTRTGEIRVLSEHGVAVAVEGGTAVEGEEAVSGPLDVALLDLRTGEADWSLTSGETAHAGVWSDGVFALIMVDGPWLLSQVAD